MPFLKNLSLRSQFALLLAINALAMALALTVTLRNGTFTGTSTQNYTCGDQNQ